jgi:hypothetical protein
MVRKLLSVTAAVAAVVVAAVVAASVVAAAVVAAAVVGQYHDILKDHSILE